MSDLAKLREQREEKHQEELQKEIEELDNDTDEEQEAIEKKVEGSREDVLISKREVEDIVKGLVAHYEKRIAETDDRVKQMQLTLEMQEMKSNVGKMKGSGIEVLAVFHPPVDHQKLAADPHRERPDLQGHVLRFCNNKPDIRSLRRSQGWNPVLDADSNEVRYMDGVLMSMEKNKYQKTWLKPKKDKKTFREHAREISERFHNRGKELGVETYGDITYDKVGEPNG